MAMTLDIFIDNKKVEITPNSTILYTADGTEIMIDSSLTDTSLWGYEVGKPNKPFIIYFDDIKGVKNGALPVLGKPEFEQIKKDMAKAMEELGEEGVNLEAKKALQEKHYRNQNKRKVELEVGKESSEETPLPPEIRKLKNIINEPKSPKQNSEAKELLKMLAKLGIEKLLEDLDL